MPSIDYDDVAVQCPALCPSMPEWEWVNVHDGKSMRQDVMIRLLAQRFGDDDVIVVFHSEEPFAAQMSQGLALASVEDRLLKGDITIADLAFEKFISISQTGLATLDA